MKHKGNNVKGQGEQTTVVVVSLSQELTGIVANAVDGGRNPATPHTCSTTQNMEPSPLHQGLQHEQLASCPAVQSEFGSVCNQAIRQVSARDGEVAVPRGVDEALAKHHAQQGDEGMELLAELEVDSCPDHEYPPLHELDVLQQGLNRGQPA